MGWISRFYGAVTAIVGIIHVIYNGLWLGRPWSPFQVPPWLIVFELAWAVISLDVLLRYRRRGIRPPLTPTIYTTYTAVTLIYTLILGMTHPALTDPMIPEWWKAFSLGVGILLLSGGGRLALEKVED